MTRDSNYRGGRSKALRGILVVFILSLCLVPALAAAEGSLVCCEYSIFGGMENAHTTYTIARGESWVNALLTIEKDGISREYPLSWTVLRDLEDYMEARDPAAWAALPDREEYALDAPGRHLVLTYDDGALYTLSDSKEASGLIFRETEMFLNSYLASDPETLEMSFSSFDGGGPEYTAVFSAPEKVWVETRRQYDEPYDEMATGSGYTETMIFHGRVPGRTEMTIEIYGPLTPVYEGPLTVYILEVDESYNVRLVEEKQVDQTGEPAE